MIKPLALQLLLPSLAFGQGVLVVDDTPGPGVDYAEIQDAVDAAGPLDRIEVRHGDYGGFTVTRQVTIMGEDPSSGAVEVDFAVVQGVPAGDIVTLADLGVGNLRVRDCGGVVMADQVVGCGQAFQVESSIDVRIQSMYTGVPDTVRQASVTDSFVQLSGLTIFADEFVERRVAMECRRSTVTLTHCRLSGPPDSVFWLPGEGLAAWDSQVRLLGCVLIGGENLNSFPPGQGPALVANDGTEVIESDSTFFPFFPANTTSQPGLPWTTLGGDPAVGGITTIEFRAEPGSVLRAFQGRHPLLNPIPGIAVPRTHTAERGVSLGLTPGPGLAQVPFTVPSIPRGTLIHMQSSRTRPSGQTELSNGVTLVVR